MTMPPFHLLACALSVAVSVCAALPARAQHGEELCGRTSTDADRIACTRIVAGKRVDQAAVEVCGRTSTSGDVVLCARAVAGFAVATQAVELCGRTSTSSDVVLCAQAVAGHGLEDGAVGACGRTSTSGDVVACGRAIADKSYSPEEINLCSGVATSAGVVECLSAAGRLPKPPRRQDRNHDRDRDDDRDRDRDRDDDRDRDRGAPKATLVNDSGAVIARVYVRASGAERWPAAKWRGKLRAGDQSDFELREGRWDVCVESTGGYSTWWRDLEQRENGTRLVVTGNVDDADRWSASECTAR